MQLSAVRAACCQLPRCHFASRCRPQLACGAARRMANSKYEYVRRYELQDPLLPSCFIVVRIDGKGFTK